MVCAALQPTCTIMMIKYSPEQMLIINCTLTPRAAQFLTLPVTALAPPPPQCTMGHKADKTFMFSRWIFSSISGLLQEPSLSGQDVKTSLNLNRKAQNVQKSAYFRSWNGCLPGCSKFPTVQWSLSSLSIPVPAPICTDSGHFIALWPGCQLGKINDYIVKNILNVFQSRDHTKIFVYI